MELKILILLTFLMDRKFVDGAGVTKALHPGMSRAGKTSTGGGAVVVGTTVNELTNSTNDAVGADTDSITNPVAKSAAEYLPKNYNKLEVPKFPELDFFKSVPVSCFLDILSVVDINELDEEITLEINLNLTWWDGILFKEGIWLDESLDADKYKTLSPVFLEYIWTPDISIDNLQDVQQPILMNKPADLRINFKTGHVIYLTKLTVKVRCNMNFRYYPADTQKCGIFLGSYTYPSSDLELDWSADTTGVFLIDASHPNFELAVGSVASSKYIPKSDGRKYDSIQFEIMARRKLSYHLLQTYLPSALFLIITWLCFMIPPRMIEARIGICMTTLLTLTAMFGAVRESTPVLSYVKAIDLWMLACVVFVFLTLFEFTVLLWMRFPKELEDEEQQKPAAAAAAVVEDEQDVEIRHVHQTLRKLNLHTGSLSTRIGNVLRAIVELVERFAFSLFSLLFIIFTLGYWGWLLISAGYFEWHVNARHNIVDNEEYFITSDFVEFQ